MTTKSNAKKRLTDSLGNFAENKIAKFVNWNSWELTSQIYGYICNKLYSPLHSREIIEMKGGLNKKI
ncbi:hypothetical protein KAT80_00300 [Candidatus Pacearchaeota archaeon]|nr:hypothetical protein [Candidatus Pacearchaeota archaeon]